MPKFFRGAIAWGLIGAVLLLMAASSALFARTALMRHERDVSRMVFNDNLQLLEEVKRSSGALEDSASKASETGDPASSNKPYIVVSIEDHRLWYKQGDKVLFTTQVATGSGKVLDGAAGGSQWKFETPRGRLTVQAKEEDPAWVPPDWHFVEQARKRGLGIVRLERGQSVAANDGSQIYQEGCLSVPGIFADVERADRITVEAQDSDGKAITLQADGLLAVCIQHEMDHLVGKLFVDYLSPLKREMVRKKLEKQRRAAAEA